MSSSSAHTGTLKPAVALPRPSLMPLEVTAAALAVLVHSISNSLCHFLKSQVTFTPADLCAAPPPTTPGPLISDHLTVRAPRPNTRMDAGVNPPPSLLCGVQLSCVCDAVMGSARRCRGLNWPLSLHAVTLGRVQVKPRMCLCCCCDLKSHTLAQLPQEAPVT